MKRSIMRTHLVSPSLVSGLEQMVRMVTDGDQQVSTLPT